MPRAYQPVLGLAELWSAYGLDRAVGSHRQGNQHGRVERTADMPAGVRILAELAGVSQRTVHRWRHRGIPLSIAEDICDILGFHPCEVWGNTWIEAVLSLDDMEDSWRFMEGRYRQFCAQQDRHVLA